MAKVPAGEPRGIIKHDRFRDLLEGAHFDGYKTDPNARVSDAEQFARMRAHLMKLHAGVDVEHSFVDQTGQVFDCIPINQQPSLKGRQDKIPEPPSLLDVAGARPAAATTRTTASQRDSSGLDRYGNTTECPPGHIPVRRITLEEMTRFRTLEDF
jgi:hypothetical protein